MRNELRHLATVFRAENVFTDLATAQELRDLTGLELTELVAFRPERMALHELLIRVSADFAVADGTKVEDLGLEFGRVVRVVFARYIEPEMAALAGAYATVRANVATAIAAEIDSLFSASAATPSQRAERPRARLFGRLARSRPQPAPPEPGFAREERLIADWRARSGPSRDPVQQAACAALARVVSALMLRHGRLWASGELIASVATDLACNRLGSDEIGRLLEPGIAKAVAEVPCRLLPRQAQPMVINVKGPSASGKSTLRPLLRRFAADHGVSWGDVAIVNPDVWRKLLLDYGTLGAHAQYAGAFTGEEVEIIDAKLDRYLARKAWRGDLPHVLLDRFRFDRDIDADASRAVMEAGHAVFLFFTLAPPDVLVERAWRRGVEFGRFKAADDTLAHCVEACTRLPALLFPWVERPDKGMRFEFLDTSVALSQRPRTIAFGAGDTLNVLDIKGMLDIERFRRVNVDATTPDALYPDTAALAPERNTGFLVECARRFRTVQFADRTTGRIYLRLASGVVAGVDPDALRRAAADPEVRAGVAALAPDALDHGMARPQQPCSPDVLAPVERAHTVGAWGPWG